MKTIQKYLPSLLIFAIFEAVAITLGILRANAFYFFNFTYIGSCLAVGLALFANKVPWARRFVQLMVGCYMLFGLGFIGRENMQIEGFWYYLFTGVFAGATIHYLVAKIAGPAIFGRGWCGYACWTAMVLDFLPWKKSPGRRQKLGAIRYCMLVASLLLVLSLMYAGIVTENLLFIGLIIGNVIYYTIGILLAAILKDNRAFCKYVCPIGVLMKPAASISLMRIKCDTSMCINCNKCLKACPMDVNMKNNSRGRRGATECILCCECVNSCPVNALDLKIGK